MISESKHGSSTGLDAARCIIRIILLSLTPCDCLMLFLSLAHPSRSHHLSPPPPLRKYRSQEGIKASMALKDAMRECCVGDVVEAAAALVATYSESRPLLAAAVLEVLWRLVAWIDIHLVANHMCVLLYTPYLKRTIHPTSHSCPGVAIRVLPVSLSLLGLDVFVLYAFCALVMFGRLSQVRRARVQPFLEPLRGAAGSCSGCSHRDCGQAHGTCGEAGTCSGTQHCTCVCAVAGLTSR